MLKTLGICGVAGLRETSVRGGVVRGSRGRRVVFAGYGWCIYEHSQRHRTGFAWASRGICGVGGGMRGICGVAGLLGTSVRGGARSSRGRRAVFAGYGWCRAGNAWYLRGGRPMGDERSRRCRAGFASGSRLGSCPGSCLVRVRFVSGFVFGCVFGSRPARVRFVFAFVFGFVSGSCLGSCLGEWPARVRFVFGFVFGLVCGFAWVSRGICGVAGLRGTSVGGGVARRGSRGICGVRAVYGRGMRGICGVAGRPVRGTSNSRGVHVGVAWYVICGAWAGAGNAWYLRGGRPTRDGICMYLRLFLGSRLDLVSERLDGRTEGIEIHATVFAAFAAFPCFRRSVQGFRLAQTDSRLQLHRLTARKHAHCGHRGRCILFCQGSARTLLPASLKSASASPRNRNSSRGICARAIPCTSGLSRSWAMTYLSDQAVRIPILKTLSPRVPRFRHDSRMLSTM